MHSLAHTSQDSRAIEEIVLEHPNIWPRCQALLAAILLAPDTADIPQVESRIAVNDVKEPRYPRPDPSIIHHGERDSVQKRNQQKQGELNPSERLYQALSLHFGLSRTLTTGL
jgi:hypothetical protein